MPDDIKHQRPRARLAKGFRDTGAAELRGIKEMLRTIEAVYERYGFEPVEQPFVEYTDALGKFLPDRDRPNEGVFSFQDDDEQWLSLRYDLTAPLARYVAENRQQLAMPYRSYRQGWVFRNEKPGPGRYRQFMQFDADTVGSDSPAADAEVCMMAADTMEALGIERGQYVIKINHRKILNALMERIDLRGDENALRRFAVFRAIDKLDRLGWLEVQKLLGPGRLDESGDFTSGVDLTMQQIDRVQWFLLALSDIRSRPRYEAIGNEWNESKIDYTPDEGFRRNDDQINDLERHIGDLPSGQQAITDLRAMDRSFTAAEYFTKRIQIDKSIVRGLEYYTGPVFECELLMETKDDAGQTVRFGSVGGGGRYDDLVARFTGERVPATGFSIGVSRLYSALKLAGLAKEEAARAPVVVLVMDRERIGDYQRLTSELRNAGIRAEMYLGSSGMKAQLKYADRRGAPLVIIQGTDERARGEVQIKDLALGAELARDAASRAEYRDDRRAQFSVPEAEMVRAVGDALKRRGR